MPELDARTRARLPDSAFAYIDSKGRRRLPIHDEAHVRNALARFDRVVFEDEAARDRSRARLLRAAKRHGIVPLGFIRGQLEPHRSLPSGLVTLLMTDVEGSTGLLARLGDGYRRLLADLRALLRTAVREGGGREVDARADEFFAAFSDARGALAAAVAIQRALRSAAWADGIEVRMRIGIHSGRPAVTAGGYVGLDVHAAARVCAAAEGGQIVMTRATCEALGGETPPDVVLRDLGTHPLHGLPEPVELCEVVAAE